MLRIILIDEMINLEGGYTDDPSDSGGKTKYGITEATARENGYKGDMKDLDRHFAISVYSKKYWDRIYLDEIYSLTNAEVVRKLFNIAVNAGTSRASQFLQKTLNVFIDGDLKIDGSIGKKTLGKLKEYMDKRCDSDGVRCKPNDSGCEVLLKTLNVFQGHFYLDLVERRPKDKKYIFGWINKRIR